MVFEDTFFEGKKVKWLALEPFGFAKDIAGDYLYLEDIMEGDFEAQIRISPSGQITGLLMDKALAEPYLSHQVTSPVGGYVTQVRQSYRELLERIVHHCFESSPFMDDQANRLVSFIESELGDLPDFPFKSLPQARVFRHPSNQKWYALFMVLKWDKLLSKEELTTEQAGQDITIVNLKISEEILPTLLNQKGCFPSYHMNKRSWLTIVLDESLPDESIQKLLEQSKSLVGPRNSMTTAGKSYWLLPANLKYYDIDRDFAMSDWMEWDHKSQIVEGDLVGIYITAPIQVLRYICRVEKVENKNSGSGSMHLFRLLTLSDQDYPLQRLKDLGVKAVRGPRRMSSDLVTSLEMDFPLLSSYKS